MIAHTCAIRSKFFSQDARPGPIHQFLVQQGKPLLVVTTTYDTLLEHVFREHGKPYAVVTHFAYAEDKNNLGKVAVQYSEHPEQTEIRPAEDVGIDLDARWVFYKVQGTFDLFTRGEDGREEVDSMMITEEDYIAWLSRRAIPTRFSRLFQKRPFLF
ncbi:hypothetical protein U14_00439 [Candidatus Moduliflexus flocculans]|uniref:Uncharacterized protein n=1 Tax=Candidatus Moduliflexus flocculans TaxID=1499966 RepID=A0A0S6VQ43_9BACT|nr:hypothetical protein U14_00439 [Candidatus Moduliflexus flocculans]